MTYYLLIKHLHVAAVAVSFAGFFARGILMLRDSPLLNARAVRVLPHVVDTVLLVSAIALAVMLGQYPFVHGWLTAKVLGLMAYIVVGAVGLRYGPTKRVRAVAWVGALGIFLYIVAVARTRDVALGVV